MKTYLVGGAVRDELMGLPVKDRDWVVIGATPEHMVAQGFRPVGADFPVFLHPLTQEEHALARTERKTAPGYRGFVIHADLNVTLDQDLGRRDLTINAMARDEHGALIDPYGGEGDIRNKTFRHVGTAFAEDPVRILRVARFAARYPEFEVAPETLELMREMVGAGEVDALVPERVWKEVARGLMEARPSRMFEVLRNCDALARLLPEIDGLWHAPRPLTHQPESTAGLQITLALDHASAAQASLQVRFACLTHKLGIESTPRADWPNSDARQGSGARLLPALCDRLRVPRECQELAQQVALEDDNIRASLNLPGSATATLLARCDAFRQPDRFEEVLLACELNARSYCDPKAHAYPQSQRLRLALRNALAVDTRLVARTCMQAGKKGEQIGQAIHAARIEAIECGERTP